MSGKKLIAVLFCVCVVSAAVGAGITLLAKRGPEGPVGATGAMGPEGPPGEEETGQYALEKAEGTESQAFELEARIDELERESTSLRDGIETAAQEASDANDYAESVCRALRPEIFLVC